MTQNKKRYGTCKPLLPEQDCLWPTLKNIYWEATLNSAASIIISSSNYYKEKAEKLWSSFWNSFFCWVDELMHGVRVAFGFDGKKDIIPSYA